MNRDDLTFEFFVGGYAQPGQAGILRCRFDAETLAFEALARNDELSNPSWLTRHPAAPVLYAVEEATPEGRLAALALDGGTIRRRASLPTGGADPCHICVSPEGRHLLVSNYTGGSLAVFALDGDGIPKRMTDFHQHAPEPLPEGGNPVRQDGPHVHFACFGGGRAYVSDLGLNRVFIYDWDPERGALTDSGESIGFPAGSGPRHLTISADGERLYALCELTAEVHAFRRDGAGRWERIQTVSVASEGFSEFERFTWSAGAAIRLHEPEGPGMPARLAASTRGDDTLASFRVMGDGRLAERQIVPAGGRTPRDFNLFGDWLLAACQDGGQVAALRWNAARSRYEDTGARMEAVKPTCIAK